MNNNIANGFWEYVIAQDTKIAERVFNWLNRDNLGAIIEDGGVFWIEKTCSTATLPNYIYNYIIRWGRREGLTYLYDLKVENK